MPTSTSRPVYHGGFTREPAFERPTLLVTRCAFRETAWSAWAQSARFLEIAELSHCCACPIAEQCSHALSEQCPSKAA